MAKPRDHTGASNHKTWPRPYIFQLYTAAITHGFVWVMPITAADATSLKMSFYRIRRRSDTSNKGIIPPEYFLVTCGEWEPTGEISPEGWPLGRMPVVYNKLADGTALPSIVPADGSEPLPVTAESMPDFLAEAPDITAIQPIKQEDIALDLEDIDDFVEQLARRAQERNDE